MELLHYQLLVRTPIAITNKPNTMMRIRKITLLFVLITFSNCSFAQTSLSDFLKAVNEKYSKAYKAHVDISFYDGSHQQNKQKGEVKSDPENRSIYVRYQQTLSIKSLSGGIIVNDTEKTVYYQPAPKKNKQKKTNQDVRQLIEGLAKSPDIRLIDLGNRKKKVIQKGEAFGMDEAQFVFDGEKLTKVIYHYSNEAYDFDKVEIVYSQLSFAEKWPESEFSIDQIVHRKGTKISLTPAYSDYRLIHGGDLKMED